MAEEEAIAGGRSKAKAGEAERRLRGREVQGGEARMLHSSVGFWDLKSIY